jgi:hypothetical protein
MSAFLKNTFKIAFIAIIAGICLAGIAFSMDNTIFNNIDAYIPGNIVHLNSDALSNDYDFGVWDDHDDEVNYSNNDFTHNDADSYNVNKYGSFNKSYQDIESIDMNISVGKVTIKEGSEFKIEATDIIKDEFESNIYDGKWVISYTGSNDSNNDVNIDLNGDGLDIDINDNAGDNGSHKISIFGFDISVDSDSTTNYNYNYKTNFVITIPKGFKAENFNLEVDTGSVKIDNLITKEAYINIDTGDCNINNLTALNKSSYSVDTGNLTIDKLTAKDVTMESGVGNIKVNGIITGHNEITCDVGNVDINCKGDIDNFDYSVDCGIGTVIINDNKYTDITSEYKKNNNAENSFTLECDIGKITLNIK